MSRPQQTISASHSVFAIAPGRLVEISGGDVVDVTPTT